MRPAFYFLIVIFTIFSLFHVPGLSAQSERYDVQRARGILRQFDDLWRGISSHAVLTMQVKTVHYTRNMRLEVWSKGKEKTLVRILLPLKEKGTATLKSGNHIFTYLPKTDRTIRLTSGMMMGAWMGSHFTNDDLVKESRVEEDYDPTITFEGERDGRDIIEFTLIPKPDAAVVWGKIVLTLLVKDFIPLKELYYDEDMVIVRGMIFSNIKQLGGRPRPTIMRVVPYDKPEEYTELAYETLELNIGLDDSFFSMARLKRK
ncbi:MAG: outer membrane lipoprotein-sorting protein [Thermodesulfobacteriota bacterium]|nr:outer membrane lipoprotein-sorting protein [Thermodesulfobacteriota bacterium]